MLPPPRSAIPKQLFVLPRPLEEARRRLDASSPTCAAAATSISRRASRGLSRGVPEPRTARGHAHGGPALPCRGPSC